MPYIGNQPGTGVRSRFIYTATASQTTFSGADDNSKTLKYADSDYIDVYLNGVCLVPGTDYTASTKTSVVLTQAASLSDTLEVVAYDIATISDTVSKADGGTFEDGVTIRTADNTTQLTLESTDADANSGPVLELYRNSSSPADDDVLGEIEFHGENDADEKIQYGLIAAKLQDASDGTEDVRLSFKTITAGTERERITIQPTEVVINEDSQDLDFRVEGNSAASMFHVDALNDRIGVGVNDPDAILDISGVSAGGNVLGILRVTQRASGAAAYGLDVGLDPTFGDPVFSRIVNDVTTESFRIQRSSGNLLIGRTTAADFNSGTTQGVDIKPNQIFSSKNGDSALFLQRSGTNGGCCAIFKDANSVGSISVTASGTAFNTSSDYRLKENVTNVTDGITRVKQLSPKRFNFIIDADTTVDGFLAHEAQTIVPEAVTGTKDKLKVWVEGEELPDGVSVGDNKLDADGNTIPEYQEIDQAKLVPLLTAALQEAIAKIETLETKVAALEAE